jgi:hypothetical protein
MRGRLFPGQDIAISVPRSMEMPGRPCSSSSTSTGRGPNRTRSPSAHQWSISSGAASLNTARSATSLPSISHDSQPHVHEDKGRVGRITSSTPHCQRLRPSVVASVSPGGRRTC